MLGGSVKINVTLHKNGKRRYIKHGLFSHQRKFTGNFYHADAVNYFQRNLYVLLSSNIESHISTTNISASDNHRKVFNLNCITAGVGKFIIQF